MLKNNFSKFLVLFTVLIIVWFGFYESIYELEVIFGSDIQQNISIALAKFSLFFLNLFGYDPVLDTTTDFVILSINGNYLSHGVWIGEPCNGLKVFGLFAIFIIAFSGKLVNKLWYIPVGIFLLHIINAIRIAILAIISSTNPTLLDFNHNVTFQVIVYSFVFGLWYLWVNKFSNTDSTIEGFISNYTISQLVNIKWAFTAFFVFIFGILGSLINRLLFQEKKVILYFIGLYTVLFCASLFIYMGTYLTNNYHLSTKLYLISMEIAHFLQSSLPTLFFLVSFKFYKKSL